MQLTPCIFSQDQVNEVLDAMFERRVSEDENVIKQGDDGDNFYVIESYVSSTITSSVSLALFCMTAWVYICNCMVW